MLVSLVLLLVLTVGGFALTYLFAEEESFLWRACAGCVVGSAVFGLVCFLAACAFGFSVGAVSLSYLLTLAPLAVFARKSFREKFLIDWRAAVRTTEGADLGKFLRLGYYLFFLLLFWFFFERAMMETTGAIFIGSSHNLGDLPFHLGAVYSFTDGQNFPPENPSFAFAKFTYPFAVDLIAATFSFFGARVSDAFLLQNVFLAFALLVVFERFVYKFTGSRAAGKIAPALLFFCGGVGFLWFFKDAFRAPEGFYNYLWHLPIDYTIREEKFHWGASEFVFRWGDSLTTLFLTQRSLLLGMPLTIVALEKVWEIFSSGQRAAGSGRKKLSELTTDHRPLTTFTIGLLAGTLPLVHTHSLIVLFFVCACLFFFSLNRWREWLAFGAGVAVVAVPELLWATTGSATRFNVFADWHFGWDSRGENIFGFWARNLGLFIPLLALGVYYVASRVSNSNKDENDKAIFHFPFSIFHLLFYVPFLLLFIICNVARLAPWEWDNIKILIYWLVGSIPFVAFLLARLWEKKSFYRLIAAACFAALTLTGAIDVWRVCSRAINWELFPADSVKLAAQIKQKTEPRAMFLNAPTFNSAVVLSGRRSLMRYTGHLSSYGIDFEPREQEVERIYEGSALAASLLQKYGVEYVVISPSERDYCNQANVQLNEVYFKKFPVAFEVGDYRVYKVK